MATYKHKKTGKIIEVVQFLGYGKDGNISFSETPGWLLAELINTLIFSYDNVLITNRKQEILPLNYIVMDNGELTILDNIYFESTFIIKYERAQDMNYETYGEVINGDPTYKAIAEKLKMHIPTLIGWTDGITHYDILFTWRTEIYGTVQHGLKPTYLFL